MVTACDCHDPVVFGHAPRCKAGRGGPCTQTWHAAFDTYDHYLDHRLAVLRARDASESGAILSESRIAESYRAALGNYLL